MWLFYPPIIFWIVLLAIRHRSALLFTASNPAMPNSGLVDEDKASNLLTIQNIYPDYVATTILIHANNPNKQKNKAIDEMAIHQLNFPVILKPNSGQRGVGVKVIRDQEQVQNYFELYPNTDILLQEHVAGLEFGVFYTRLPNSAYGSIFSITEKSFPALTGDGLSSLEKLILDDPRANYMAEFLLNLHQKNLDRVLDKGEKIQLVEIGSHCRGSIFLEGSQHISDELTKMIDKISQSIDGYYFGRYDLRVASEEDLRQGKNFKILEANGVSSESANIYDPKYGLLNAYRVMFKQWALAFKIGKQNRDKGHPPSSIKEVLSAVARLNNH